MSDEETSKTESAGADAKESRGCGTLVFRLAVFAIAAAAVIALSLVWLTGKGIDSGKETIFGIARMFRPDQVVETFEEWRELEATGTDGNILEIATATASEKFTRKTNVEMFGTTLPLGTTASEITVPATYRYYIDLNGEWFLTTEGSRILVQAPRVQPSLPVAFDTAGVQKKTKSGWARWDGGTNLEELEKTVTSKLAIRAASDEAIGEAREAGREAVAKFVRSWLVEKDAWGENRFEEIVVRFEGEAEQNLSTMPATIRLEESTPESETLP